MCVDKDLFKVGVATRYSCTFCLSTADRSFRAPFTAPLNALRNHVTRLACEIKQLTEFRRYTRRFDLQHNSWFVNNTIFRFSSKRVVLEKGHNDYLEKDQMKILFLSEVYCRFEI